MLACEGVRRVEFDVPPGLARLEKSRGSPTTPPRRRLPPLQALKGLVACGPGRHRRRLRPRRRRGCRHRHARLRRRGTRVWRRFRARTRSMASLRQEQAPRMDYGSGSREGPVARSTPTPDMASVPPLPRLALRRRPRRPILDPSATRCDAGSRRHRGRPVLRPLYSRMWAVLGAMWTQREPHAQNCTLHLLGVSVLGRVAACMLVFRPAVEPCPCRAMSVRVRGACPCMAVVHLRVCT
mmetsp:Transcript_32135/g.79563  ORF Transcript_32135/g.79563 Transcript_32135/m.79563 type:complete len:239 (-) Transcript_32135:47-763(-)